MRTALIHAPIDAAALLQEVSSHGSGATTLFLGTVREVNDARDVTGIDYTAYEAMAERELAKIAAESAALHLLFQLAVGGREDARVGLDRLRRANRDDLALLKSAKELHLGLPGRSGWRGVFLDFTNAVR